MEIVNSYLNSDFNSGEIYKIEFKNCDKVYIGNTTGELQTRLTQHLTNNKSPVYQYRLHKPTIKLLVNAPSKGKRELEKVEHEWIYDFSEKLGDRLLNKQGIKPKRQEVKYQAQMTAIDAFQKSCYKTKYKNSAKLFESRMMLQKSCYTMTVLSMAEVIAMWPSVNNNQGRKQYQSLPRSNKN